MKQWLSANWDKLFGSIIVLLLAGIIGFYSSLMKSVTDLSKITERVVSTEQKVLELNNKITEIENHRKSIDNLTIQVACIVESNKNFSKWIDEIREVNKSTTDKLFNLKYSMQ